jgi:hypothetical protein
MTGEQRKGLRVTYELGKTWTDETDIVHYLRPIVPDAKTVVTLCGQTTEREQVSGDKRVNCLSAW